MTRTMTLHLRYKSLYISLLSSAKQQREMTKFYVFWRTETAMAFFFAVTFSLSKILDG